MEGKVFTRRVFWKYLTYSSFNQETVTLPFLTSRLGSTLIWDVTTLWALKQKPLLNYFLRFIGRLTSILQSTSAKSPLFLVIPTFSETLFSSVLLVFISSSFVSSTLGSSSFPLTVFFFWRFKCSRCFSKFSTSFLKSISCCLHASWTSWIEVYHLRLSNKSNNQCNISKEKCNETLKELVRPFWTEIYNFGCFTFLLIHFTITRKITSASRREHKILGVLAPIQDEIQNWAIDKNNRKRKRTKKLT